MTPTSSGGARWGNICEVDRGFGRNIVEDEPMTERESASVDMSYACDLDPQDPTLGCWRPPLTAAYWRVRRMSPHRGRAGLHML